MLETREMKSESGFSSAIASQPFLLQYPLFTAIETKKVLKYWRKKNEKILFSRWPSDHNLSNPSNKLLSILSTRAHIALPIVCPVLQGGEFLWENLQNRETLVYS